MLKNGGMEVTRGSSEAWACSSFSMKDASFSFSTKDARLDWLVTTEGLGRRLLVLGLRRSFLERCPTAGLTEVIKHDARYGDTWVYIKE